MKAVILEKKDGYAAALKDDGTIVRMRDNNYTIGDVIMMKDKKPLFSKKWGTLVAALLIFAMVGTTTMVNAESYAVWVGDKELTEDIQFIVDRKGIVTAVLDKDDDDITKYKDFVDLRIEEALLLLADDIESDVDYFDIVATSDNDKDTERFIERLRERIEERASEEDGEEIVEKPVKDEIPGNIEAITNEMVKEAKKEGIAPGKLNIINKLVPERGDRIEFGEKDLDRDDLIGLAKDNPKDLMKIFSESRGNKDGEKLPPGQEKKIEATQNENREENREEIEEQNIEMNKENNGNKGGNGKGGN
jgi:hypothetical protein